MSIFGGGFAAPPNSQCKLRQGLPQNQFTSPVRQLGVVPVSPPFGVVPRQQPALSAPPQQAPVQPAPSQNVRGMARPLVQTPAVTPNSPIGPTSYKVMKKGEAPCPICRG
jgi:hypothetical protein